jgi:hypothetical protein
VNAVIVLDLFACAEPMPGMPSPWQRDSAAENGEDE